MINITWPKQYTFLLYNLIDFLYYQDFKTMLFNNCVYAIMYLFTMDKISYIINFSGQALLFKCTYMQITTKLFSDTNKFKNIVEKR